MRNYWCDTGNYKISLKEGEYKVLIKPDGYIDFEAYAKVTAKQNTYMETFLLVKSGMPFEQGITKGTISNALTGNSIHGDSVCNTSTDKDGRYSINVPLGNYTLTLIKQGFFVSSFNIIVQSGVTVDENGTITPLLSSGANFYRIILNWEANPRDLDSHIVENVHGITTYHVFYGHKVAMRGDNIVCRVDVDDVNGYGPETITMIADDNSSYYYYIHRYAGTGTLAESGAKITVFNENQQIAVFNVPTDQINGDYWNVFAIVNGRLIIKNTISDNPDIYY